MIVTLRACFMFESPMKVNFHDQVAICITKNPTFHDHTKIVEVDYHFIQDKVFQGIISTLE